MFPTITLYRTHNFECFCEFHCFITIIKKKIACHITVKDGMVYKYYLFYSGIRDLKLNLLSTGGI